MEFFRVYKRALCKGIIFAHILFAISPSDACRPGFCDGSCGTGPADDQPIASALPVGSPGSPTEDPAATTARSTEVPAEERTNHLQVLSAQMGGLPPELLLLVTQFAVLPGDFDPSTFHSLSLACRGFHTLVHDQVLWSRIVYTAVSARVTTVPIQVEGRDEIRLAPILTPEVLQGFAERLEHAGGLTAQHPELFMLFWSNLVAPLSEASARDNPLVAALFQEDQTEEQVRDAQAALQASIVEERLTRFSTLTQVLPSQVDQHYRLYLFMFKLWASIIDDFTPEGQTTVENALRELCVLSFGPLDRAAAYLASVSPIAHDELSGAFTAFVRFALQTSIIPDEVLVDRTATVSTLAEQGLPLTFASDDIELRSLLLRAPLVPDELRGRVAAIHYLQQNHPFPYEINLDIFGRVPQNVEYALLLSPTAEIVDKGRILHELVIPGLQSIVDSLNLPDGNDNWKREVLKLYKAWCLLPVSEIQRRWEDLSIIFAPLAGRPLEVGELPPHVSRELFETTRGEWVKARTEEGDYLAISGRLSIDLLESLLRTFRHKDTLPERFNEYVWRLVLLHIRHHNLFASVNYNSFLISELLHNVADVPVEELLVRLETVVEYVLPHLLKEAPETLAVLDEYNMPSFNFFYFVQGLMRWPVKEISLHVNTMLEHIRLAGLPPEYCTGDICYELVRTPAAEIPAKLAAFVEHVVPLAHLLGIRYGDDAESGSASAEAAIEFMPEDLVECFLSPHMTDIPAAARVVFGEVLPRFCAALGEEVGEGWFQTSLEYLPHVAVEHMMDLTDAIIECIHPHFGPGQSHLQEAFVSLIVHLPPARVRELSQVEGEKALEELFMNFYVEKHQLGPIDPMYKELFLLFFPIDKFYSMADNYGDNFVALVSSLASLNPDQMAWIQEHIMRIETSTDEQKRELIRVYVEGIEKQQQSDAALLSPRH